MRSVFACLLLTALGLAAACSSGPGPSSAAPAPRAALPDCAETNGYPPCAYNGVEPYQGPEDFYPAYDYPYYPGTGVIVVPEPVPVPVPVPVPTPKPKPPKKPPPRHHRAPINPCHPQPGRPCP
jgi:hypothetical protein